MTSLPCRECQKPLASDRPECPACGCRTPFACSVCAKPLSALSLGVAPNLKHPHGAFSPAGQPLCHAHRMTRCHLCAKLFPQHEMSRHVVGEHEDRVLREGKPPRIEPVFGYFCSNCKEGAPTSTRPLEGQPPWVLGLAILATAVVLAAIILR